MDELPDHLKPIVGAMVRWLDARKDVLEWIEFAPHSDGEWAGWTYTIVPMGHERAGTQH